MLTQRYAKDIRGVLSCYDRILIMGTLPDIAHARAATRELNRRHVRIFDFSEFAQGFRDEIRANAERVAAEHGVEIEFIKKSKAFRKEDRIQEIVAERGTHPGLVHIFSAMESAHPSGHGTTGSPARPTCSRTAGDASTTTSTSSTGRSGSATFACRPGRPTVCSSA